MSIDERLGLERDDRRHESNQARLADRLKFACCRQCGSEDGMRSVRRDTLEEAMPAIAWYKEPGNAKYLFYPCPRCNHWRNIPDGYAHMSLDDIQAWLNRDPTAPDHAALAAEPEAVSQIEDSLEG